MIYHSKKMCKKLIFTTLSCLALTACGNDPGAESNSLNDKPKVTKVPAETPTPVPTSAEDAITPTPSEGVPVANEPTPETISTPHYHVTVYDNLFRGTRVDLDLREGEVVDTDRFTQLLGYDFVGCYDSLDATRELCIDARGNICTELLPTMVLYAWYEPKNYTLSFTCDGKAASLYGVQNVNAAYDANLYEILPLDRRIKEEEELIYSVSYGQTVLADILETEKVPLNEATLKDIEIFADNNKIEMNLNTVCIKQSAQHNTQEVCIKDAYSQFEQRFKDDFICDNLSLENFDFELLEQLGYNTAVIEISCTIREKDDGTQEIYVYNNAYENDFNDSKKDKKNKKNAMEDYLLGEFEHDCKEKDTDETATHTITVSLSRLKASSGIYVYYGASGFGDDDWYRVSTNITVEFERRLDK